VARRDDEDVARVYLRLFAVVHADVQTPLEGIAVVMGLAALGADERAQ
jgi:hypothetical protein